MLKFTTRARFFALAAHGSQMYGMYPYIFHLDSVALWAEKFCFSSHVVAACYLHDTLEDCAVSYSDIKREFGELIADAVYAVTDELGKTRQERHEKTYPKIRGNYIATAVKLCDRIANIEESIRTGAMIDKYRAEHSDFVKALQWEYDDGGFMDRAWDKLEELLTKSKQKIGY